MNALRNVKTPAMNERLSCYLIHINLNFVRQLNLLIANKIHGLLD